MWFCPGAPQQTHPELAVGLQNCDREGFARNPHEAELDDFRKCVRGVFAFEASKDPSCNRDNGGD
jgi:hypothetical protein